jgi:ApaG protein
MFEQESWGLRVSVEPQFLAEESEPEINRYVWAYTIEIENKSRAPVQLISRFWKIIDQNGVTQEVRGHGVVGQQPVIAPGQSFRYTSAAPLAAPSGVMQGAYSMVRVDDGTSFDVMVPAFALDSPHERRRAN